MKTIIISAFAVLTLGIISCNNTSNPTTSKTDTPPPAAKVTVGQKEFYVCEMDSGVVSDKPGKCPKCGMDLTKKMLPDTTKVTVK